MNKLITVLALMALTLPLTAAVLFSGKQNLLDASKSFFSRLFEHVMHFGVT